MMRVLIIDDSVVSRRLISDALASANDIQTMTAPSGKIGLTKIAQECPDLVTLDVEMPDMNGIETLKIIRQHYPLLPVIMVSRLTELGAATTIDALFYGANDYVSKPEKTLTVAQSITAVQQQLLPKIRALCSASKHNQLFQNDKVNFTDSAVVESHKTVKIIAIGSSTGGPSALATLLSGVAGRLTVPIVIAQHTLPMFSQHIAKRLTQITGLNMKQGCRGQQLKAKEIYLAPGNQNMLLTQKGEDILLETSESADNEPTPSVDRLFHTVANIYGANVLAVVLTGMGRDGLAGCETIRNKGGQILVQDEPSSIVWGMPGAVANAGLADAVVPLQQLASAIIHRIKS